MKISSKVTTAIVPVGGYGTRFLPASKSNPKEMFPLLDKPVVYYVVEELVKSGIENIIFVVGHRKQSVEDFFSFDETYENFLLAHGKEEQVAELRRIAAMANFSFVYTSPPYGNGAALHAAKHALAPGQPFVLTWGDEFVITPDVPRIKQCIDTFEEFGKPVISTLEISNLQDRCRYGMASIEPMNGRNDVCSIKEIVEKPALGKEPSAFAAHGAYVLPYKVFDLLPDLGAGRDGELWLTDVLNLLAKKGDLLGRIITDGVYLDCGTPKGLLFSSVTFALARSPYAEEFKAFLKESIDR